MPLRRSTNPHTDLIFICHKKAQKSQKKTTTDPHAKTLRRKEKKFQGLKKGNLEIQKSTGTN